MRFGLHYTYLYISFMPVTQKTTHSSKELAAFARSYAKNHLRDTRLVIFSGPLGAGKTTFVQGVAAGLGIHSGVSSPTFALIQEHSIPKTKRVLVHVDLYRIKKKRDLDPLHLIDYLTNPNMLVCVEWADRFPRFWNAFPHTHINIALGKNNSRRILLRHK